MQLLPSFVTLTAITIAMACSAAAQNIDQGATIFRQKCGQCHRVGVGAKNLVGPQLNGIVGRASGSSEGFSYSQIQKKMRSEGLVWTVDKLMTYLESPRKFMPGTRMAFAGLPDAQQRQDVVGYLKSFNEKGEQAAAK